MKSQHLALLFAVGGALAAPAPVPEEVAGQQGQVAQVEQQPQVSHNEQTAHNGQMAQHAQVAQDLSVEQRALLTKLAEQFPQLNAVLGPFGSGGLLGNLPIIGPIISSLPLHTILRNLPLLGPLLGDLLTPLIGPPTSVTTPSNGIPIPGTGITLPFPLSILPSSAEGQNVSPIAKREAEAHQAAMAILSQLVVETQDQVQQIQQLIADHANEEPEKLIDVLVQPLTLLRDNLQTGVTNVVSRAGPGGLLSGLPIVGDLLSGGAKSPLGLVGQLLDTLLNLVQSLLGGSGPAGGATGLTGALAGGTLNNVLGKTGLGSLVGGLLLGANSPLAPLVNQVLGTVTSLLPGAGTPSSASNPVPRA
ncbi:hypothetical protein QBC43DRAFT_328876 [Cladorrhinum sp. PSN259]|nr:hypothetical protein QBC43DRAFT_328876 [Cladorrhinum sp. PSN259]